MIYNTVESAYKSPICPSKKTTYKGTRLVTEMNIFQPSSSYVGAMASAAVNMLMNPTCFVMNIDQNSTRKTYLLQICPCCLYRSPKTLDLLTILREK